MRFFLTLLLLFAAAFLCFVALLWWQQERVVFQPPPPPWPDAGDARRVDYQAADGQPLLGYVVPPPDTTGPRRVLIAFHGNADLAAWQIPWARELAARTGWTVLLAEYRGYAGLGGVPTHAASRLDARAAYDWARTALGVAPEDVALHGHSLGSAVAVELAEETRPRALLLVAPFTSARDMARRIATPAVGLVWPLLGRVRFDTRAVVATLDVPVAVAHGLEDEVIPARMGREVHAAARRRGPLLLVPGAGHGDVMAVAGERYWAWVEEALR